MAKTSLRAEDWELITPSDSVSLARRPDALVVTAGSVALRSYRGNDIIRTVSAETEIPYQPEFVLATGTTSTVYALYNSQR